MKHLKNNNQGFTLVEMIVTIAILAVVAVPMFNAFVVGANTTIKAQQFGSTTDLVENTVEVVKGTSVNDIEAALLRIGSTVVPHGKSPGDADLDPDVDTEFKYTVEDVDLGGGKVEVDVTLDCSPSSNTIINTINTTNLAIITEAYASGFQGKDGATDPDQIAFNDMKNQASEYIRSNFGQVIETDIDVTLTGRTITMDFSSTSAYPAVLHVSYHHYGYFTYRSTDYPLEYVTRSGSALEIKPTNLTLDEINALTEYGIFFSYTPLFYSGNSTVGGQNGDQIIINNPQNLEVDFFLVKQYPEGDSPTGVSLDSGDMTYSCNLSLVEKAGTLSSGRDSHLELYSNIRRSLQNNSQLSAVFNLALYHDTALINANLPYSEQLSKEGKMARVYELTIEVYDGDSTGREKIATLTTFKLE